MICSTSFATDASEENWSIVAGSHLSPFLKSSVTIAFFQSEGIWPVCNDCWNISWSMGTT